MPRYSVQPKNRIFVKSYRILFFIEIEKNISKYIIKNLSSKCNQKLIDHAKQSVTDALKTASKRAIQKNSRSNRLFD